MNRPLKLVIADDEPLVRRGLRRSLARMPGLIVAAEARDGRAALEAIRRERPDLVLLDIQMPGLTGLEVAEALVEPEAPAVIFVTAYDSFAVQAFALHAVDYLLKPFDDERLATALDRARQRLGSVRDHAGIPGAATLVDLANRRSRYAERLLVRSLDRIEVVDVASVDWFEAADNYVRLHIGARRPVIREPLRELEARLDPDRFARVHRSAIVNLGRVRSITTRGSGDATAQLASGEPVPVSRNHRPEFERRLAARP
jgi:two-component system LytT family response regulator